MLASFGESASSAESSGVNLYHSAIDLVKAERTLCVSVPFIDG